MLVFCMFKSINKSCLPAVTAEPFLKQSESLGINEVLPAAATERTTGRRLNVQISSVQGVLDDLLTEVAKNSQVH